MPGELVSIVPTSGKSFCTAGYSKTAPQATTISSANPMRNRQRLSSHALYQSISVLRDDSFEKDLFQRDGRDVDRYWIEDARFVQNPRGSGARQQREDAAFAPHPDDAGRTERHGRCRTIEYELNAAMVLP